MGFSSWMGRYDFVLFGKYGLLLSRGFFEQFSLTFPLRSIMRAGETLLKYANASPSLASSSDRNRYLHLSSTSLYFLALALVTITATQDLVPCSVTPEGYEVHAGTAWPGNRMAWLNHRGAYIDRDGQKLILISDILSIVGYLDWQHRGGSSSY